jgi:hypothetical protein
MIKALRSLVAVSLLVGFSGILFAQDNSTARQLSGLVKEIRPGVLLAPVYKLQAASAVMNKSMCCDYLAKMTRTDLAGGSVSTRELQVSSAKLMVELTPESFVKESANLNFYAPAYIGSQGFTMGYVVMPENGLNIALYQSVQINIKVRAGATYMIRLPVTTSDKRTFDILSTSGLAGHALFSITFSGTQDIMCTFQAINDGYMMFYLRESSAPQKSQWNLAKCVISEI